MSRHRTDAELPVRIRRGGGPLPTQLAEQIRDLVAVGTLRPGDALPSTRALAARLDISRGSVTTAYDQLTGEGFFIADRGGTRITPELPALPPRPRGTTPDTPRRSVPAASGVAAAAGPGTAVAADPGENAAGGPGVHAETGPAAEATTAPEARTEAPVPALRYDLRPGTPDVSALTTTAWRAAWRTAAAQPSLGHPPQGSAALRRELAEHLRTGRSVPADPEDLLVTGGARDGLRLLLTVLAQRLGRALTVAVEDPGYPSLHRVPAALGHRVVPVPLDAQGLDPAHLETGPARPDVVLVTPSHQYPLGASMPAARRAELLAWAVEHEALLVEDDYDSELRYVGDPLPALAAMDTARYGAGDRVATLGSFAKTLTPGLGLGFLLMPPQLRRRLLAHKRDAGAPVSGIVQDAMTGFLAEGGLRRHTARMRREYRRRRDLLARVLAPDRLPPGVRVLPMDGGLHTVVELPDRQGTAGERRLVDAAARQEVGVAGLTGYWSRPGARAGLVVGFGGLSEPRLEEALRRLRAALVRELPAG
ncbi:PLP-dependent aminotransferase family protein [Rothia kristinae]|uniref:MocR-like pyridoxine biosynthesis transcription factor PdxR n=1 Tax=Rothia kristinae TaxID=37923 RepID=UPI003417F59D